jgi:PAS domain S-box-containing protein
MAILQLYEPPSAGKNNQELLREIEELRVRLEEAEATIEAIQGGSVDALVVSGPDGEKVFALEGADHPYRVMLDVMNEGVVTMSADGGILTCNSRFANFVKAPMEQILGKPLAQFTIESYALELSSFLTKALEESTVATIALSRTDGTSMPVTLSSGAFEVGGVPVLCVVVMDRTDMLAAMETRLLLASIVETSNDAIISKSLDNSILTWNAAAERIYGFSAQEAIGQSIFLIMPHDQIEEVEMINEKIVLGQSLVCYETLQLTKSAIPIQVSLTASPLINRNGSITGISLVARDITKRKKAEADLMEYRQHLEEMVQQRTSELETVNEHLKIKIIEHKQTEEVLWETDLRVQNLNEALQAHVAIVEVINKELDSYSHSVSHDLRMPLRFVNRIAHTLLQDTATHLSSEASQQVEMILQSTDEMAKLIDDLLTFSWASREPLQKRRVNLQKLFQVVSRKLQHAQETQGHTCVDIVIHNLAWGHCDRALMKQVASNLLENAFKFTQRREEALITIGCMEKTAEIIYFVQDNGVGFDMKDLDSLFVPFHRLHKSAGFEGTGIGLSLVKRIIDRHGGRVWAEGQVDKGATFYFTLPNLQNSASS